jgi:hypothetical protein
MFRVSKRQSIVMKPDEPARNVQEPVHPHHGMTEAISRTLRRKT